MTRSQISCHSSRRGVRAFGPVAKPTMPSADFASLQRDTAGESQNIRQTSVCRGFRQWTSGGNQRQTEVCRIFPAPSRPTLEFANSIFVAARVHSISDCNCNPRCDFGKRLDRRFNYQTRFLKEYCFSWPVPLPISLPIYPIFQARSAEALFWRDRTRRRSVEGWIEGLGEACGCLCERRRNYAFCELA